MKTLKCSKCDRVQQSGNFCLDCGGKIVEKISAGVKFKPILSKRPAESVKKTLRDWLARIGVQQSDIQLYTNEKNKIASIEYSLGGQRYHFRSATQSTSTLNLAAIEQLVHFRVLGIERGIETTEQAFAGYVALPDPEQHLKSLSDEELRQELKRIHPDTGLGDTVLWQRVMAEKQRRELNAVKKDP